MNISNQQMQCVSMAWDNKAIQTCRHQAKVAYKALHHKRREAAKEKKRLTPPK